MPIVYASWGPTSGHVLGAAREPRQLKPSGEPLQLKAFSTRYITKALGSCHGGGPVSLTGPSVPFTRGSVPLPGLFNC